MKCDQKRQKNKNYFMVKYKLLKRLIFSVWDIDLWSELDTGTSISMWTCYDKRQCSVGPRGRDLGVNWHICPLVPVQWSYACVSPAKRVCVCVCVWNAVMSMAFVWMFWVARAWVDMIYIVSYPLSYCILNNAFSTYLLYGYTCIWEGAIKDCL